MRKHYFFCKTYLLFNTLNIDINKHGEVNQSSFSLATREGEAHCEPLRVAERPPGEEKTGFSGQAVA
jgi:hypothetical protein